MVPTTSDTGYLIALVKLSNDAWTVVVGGLPKFFASTEQACDYLVDNLNVQDDEVDVGICHLYGNNHSRCLFTDSGEFVRTEEK